MGDIEFKDKMLAKVMDKLPIGIGIYEIIGDNLIPYYVSDHALDIFGKTREQYEALEAKSGESHLKLGYSKADIKKFSADYYLDNGKAYEDVSEVYRADGKAIWVRSVSVFEKSDNGYICYTTMMDVTEAMHKTQDEEKKNQTYKILIEESDVIVFDYDPQDDTMMYSVQEENGERGEHILLNYLSNIKSRDALHKDFREIFKTAIENASETFKKNSIEYMADYRKRGFRWYRAKYKSVADQNGNVFRVVGTIRDIQEEKENIIKLRTKAEIDSLSGIYNRNTAMEIINKKLANSAERDSYVFMIFDIDDFKSINDRYGHPIGDLAIKTVADAIRDEFRHSDTLGRLGGDEFCGFFATEYGIAAASEKAADFIDKIQAASEKLALGVKISVSIGVAMAPKHGKNFNDLYKNADQALYRAKARGKDCFVVYGENYD